MSLALVGGMVVLVLVLALLVVGVALWLSEPNIPNDPNGEE